MKKSPTRNLINFCLAAYLLVGPGAALATEELLKEQCGACHVAGENGKLSRISEQRKTPEGWEMTINRMRLIHGLELSRTDIEISTSTTRALVKYLSDAQGLAPQEARDHRYLIEQRLNTQESSEEHHPIMCGRCHSNARYALQRRTKEEWHHLVHFHAGQFPSIEYSLYGRDRDWLRIALDETVPALAKSYPFESTSWEKWQAAAKPDLSGQWLLSGRISNQGQLFGTMNVESTDTKDLYNLKFDGKDLNGVNRSGTGSAIVYTGYEWRASLTISDTKYRLIMAASPDGMAMTGRLYERDQTSLGGDMVAVRSDGKPRLLSISPTHLQRGETEKVQIIGSGFKGPVQVPSGLSAVELNRDSNLIELEISSTSNTSLGLKTIVIGDAVLEQGLALHNGIDSLVIEPDYSIARVGEVDGNAPPLNAIFTAYGFNNGADGLPQTDDDLALGIMDDGVSWQVEPWDEIARHYQDTRYAGLMDSDTGEFKPALSGPNKDRIQSTNNVGNLRVIATLGDGDKKLEASSHLIVTVQRWIDPPLK